MILCVNTRPLLHPKNARLPAPELLPAKFPDASRQPPAGVHDRQIRPFTAHNAHRVGVGESVVGLRVAFEHREGGAAHAPQKGLQRRTGPEFAQRTGQAQFPGEIVKVPAERPNSADLGNVQAGDSGHAVPARETASLFHDEGGVVKCRPALAGQGFQACQTAGIGRG